MGTGLSRTIPRAPRRFCHEAPGRSSPSRRVTNLAQRAQNVPMGSRQIALDVWRARRERPWVRTRRGMSRQSQKVLHCPASRAAHCMCQCLPVSLLESGCTEVPQRFAMPSGSCPRRQGVHLAPVARGAGGGGCTAVVRE